MKPLLVLIACLTLSNEAWSQQTVAEFKWTDFPLSQNVAPAYQSICEHLSTLQSERQQLLGTNTSITNFSVRAAISANQVSTANVESAKKALEEKFPVMTALLQRGAKAVSLDGRMALEIANTNDTPLQLSLLTIAKPNISAPKYAVQGEFRYDAAPLSAGVLEMVSYFQPNEPGLIKDEIIGPMIGGWNPFSIAFDSAIAGESAPPTRLEIKIFISPRSTVYLGPLSLVQYPARKTWFYGRTEHPWWSSDAGGWIGGIGGTIFGCLGGLLGVLGSKGKARAFIVAVLKIEVGLGILSIAAGLVALLQHQPYAVWYPLLLIGVVLPAISVSGLFTMSRRYRQEELRRMQALDASG